MFAISKGRTLGGVWRGDLVFAAKEEEGPMKKSKLKGLSNSIFFSLFTFLLKKRGLVK